MISKFRKFVYETRGLAAIEFALIMPFMLIVYFGLFDITALVSMNRNYFNAANMVMSPTPAAQVRVEVFGYRKSGLTISQVWKVDNGQATTCGAAPATSAMDPLMVAGNDLVVARVCMTYEVYAANFLGHSIVNASSFFIAESITQRPRSTLKLTCYNTTVGGAVCS